MAILFLPLFDSIRIQRELALTKGSRWAARILDRIIYTREFDVFFPPRAE